jgi:asparagine synthase (glutamine-hydrolysing)
MAHGLEVRSPLLAKSVVELALSLPSALKVADGATKVILRRLAERYLPADILGLPKRGFHAPVDAWFRGELRSRFEAEVLGGTAAVPEWIDLGAVRRLWEEHRSGRFHHGATLWAVWALAVWSAGSARPVARLAAS